MAKIQSTKNSTRKEIIIEKASKLFREKGFGASSMRDLAGTVGVEAASLYNHIESKSEILQEICFKVANEFMSNLDSVLHSGEGILKRMERIIRFHIRMMMDNFEYVYISDHEWRHLPEPYLSNFLSQRRNYRKVLADLVAEGVAKNELRPQDPYVTVLTMLSAISGIESWQRSRKTVSAETVGNELTEFLLRGMKS